ncbi:MAG: Spy/CpxP family protein refolding chaperone [Prosthecobacter sp.]
MKSLLCSLLLVAASWVSAANVDEWLKSGLLHPDFIASVKDELELTPEQQSKMIEQVETARPQAEPLERAVKEEQKALNQLLQNSQATADTASAQLAKLIEAEAALKQLQLRVLIGLRDVLTPDQQLKARKLALQKNSDARSPLTAPPGAETKLMAKVARLKSALEVLGTPPTDAMKERGEEIEALIKKGEGKAADAALDQLIADSHLEELEVEPDAVDFSKFEPGSTDVESLKQRYEDVKTAGQEILSLPLMRELLQARDAFEQAKEAQDADQVGRILTYVEGKLKRP